MKSKDQTLLEEAYKSINEGWGKDTPPYNIDSETEKQYWTAFGKLEKGKITTQQWGDICAKLLGDMMNANKKQKEEDKDYFEYWKKREEEGTNF